jgi:hypothetical protein
MSETKSTVEEILASWRALEAPTPKKKRRRSAPPAVAASVVELRCSQTPGLYRVIVDGRRRSIASYSFRAPADRRWRLSVRGAVFFFAEQEELLAGIRRLFGKETS